MKLARRRVFAGVVVAAAAATAVAYPAQATTGRAAAAPAPIILSAALAGPGCLAGSGSGTVFIDAAGASLTIQLARYTASIGPNQPPNNPSTNCGVAVQLRIPASTKLNFPSVETRGFVSLDPGVSASQQLSYRLNRGTQTTARNSFTGPRTGNFRVTSRFNPPVFSQCGVDTLVTINSTAVLATRDQTRSGRLGPDTINRTFQLRLKYTLSPCIE